MQIASQKLGSWVLITNRSLIHTSPVPPEWVSGNGFGIVVGSFRDIAPAVQKLIEKNTFEEFRRRTVTYENHALFDVARILETCYERSFSLEEKVGARA